MQHLAGAVVVVTLVIEVGTNIALLLVLVLVLVLVLSFSLAFVLIFTFVMALVCQPLLSGLLGLVDVLLLVAVRTAHAVRARLSVAEVKARKR